MTNTAIHLEHVYITVRDAAESIAFYRKVFPDWGVRWEGQSADGGRWVHFGPAGGGQPDYLSISEKRDAAAPGKPYESLCIQHVGFTHPDVYALEARLAMEGIQANDRAEDGNYRRIYYLDPNGIEIELVQEIKER